MAVLQQSQFFSNAHKYYNLPPQLSASSSPSNSPLLPTRRALSLFLASATCNFSGFPLVSPAVPFNNVTATRPTPTPLPVSDFVELPNSGGVRALDLRIPDQQHAQTPTPTPSDGDRVVIHYYARLAAKQGWRFDSTYDHKDDHGDPVPFQFVLGSGKVIAGIESAVRTMKVGGIRRVIIPPSQGYQNTSQEPLPPNFFDRQRLFTTIFNPTRLANGEGSTLGTLIFDIELISLRHY